MAVTRTAALLCAGVVALVSAACSGGTEAGQLTTVAGTHASAHGSPASDSPGTGEPASGPPSTPSGPSPSAGPPQSAGPGPSPSAGAGLEPPPSPGAPPARPVTLAFAGDVHAERSAGAVLDGLGPMTDVLAAADVAVVNLETAIVSGPATRPADKQYTYAAPPEVLPALEASGVDVVSMANNHALDYGAAGARDTLAAMAAHPVPDVVGFGDSPDDAWEPYVTTAGGQRIGVLAASDVVPALSWLALDGPGMTSAKPGQEERLLDATAELAARADVVAVYLHWGRDRQPCPTERQQALASRLVDAGADIVTGSHSHVVQPVVEVDGATVAYGLGNFAWYHSQPPTDRTGVLTVTVAPDGSQATTWHPARIEAGRPSPDGEPVTRPATGCG